MSRQWVLLIVLGATAAVLLLPPAAHSHRPITTNIVFKREIAQIFQRKCFHCHTDNNLAMSLASYSLARPWARAIREEVSERRMPPWSAVAGFGHFANDNSLTQREIDIILGWADGGAPSGVPKAEEAVPPVYVPSGPEWQLGPPDARLAIEPHTIEAGSGVSVRHLEVPSGLSRTTAIKAVAFKPQDRRGLRYVAISEAASGRWLATWTPWHPTLELPDRVVHRLPARSRLRVEIGYRATDEPIETAGEIGLYFDARSRTHATATVIDATPLTVDPETTAARVLAERVLSRRTTVVAIWPEPGAGATSVEVTASLPDGVVSPLVWLKDYRPDWPSPYVLRTPVTLPRGTRVRLIVYFTNTTGEPLRASPRATLVGY